ncbi:transcriptional repressor [Ruminococcaceae bacterium CPB6]|jgi:Fur family ferric uptake transcriptional regulator|uniref:Transcriptional repressor n=1 Tax=Caproicibacterium lactatifermentans TaxID=2666138 RepID=A0A859DQN8_9FIRM|nr:transcriptional repressor [Caproicibacterium lactatifermentans]ARP50516.1 transcriptional repressor [Ruminococcaceae bacterium CPB6]QKN23765.1 transcriptional repressor [Caproicibacterium lactatifermentans]
MADEMLKAKELKTTCRREAILTVLRTAQKPLTAEEVYLAVLPNMHMSVSTAYRTLATLFEKEIVMKEVGQDGKAYFRLNDHRHCHILRCTGCGEVIELSGCPIEPLEKQWAEKTGYQITGHRLELSGLCPKCAAKKDEKPDDK